MIAYALIALVILTLCAVFVVTRSFFLRGVVLPRLAQASNITLHADEVSLNPFSSVSLRRVTFALPDGSVQGSAALVEARFALTDLLSGRIHLQDVLLDSPVIEVRPASGVAAPASAASPASLSPGTNAANPASIQLRRVSLRRGLVSSHATGGAAALVVSNLDITLDVLAPATEGRLQVSAEILRDQPGSGRWTGRVQGGFTLTAGRDLLPQAVAGTARADITQALGNMASLAGLAAILDVRLTPDELQPSSLRFEQAGVPLGSLTAAGPFRLADREGRIQIDLAAVDRRLPAMLSSGSRHRLSDATLEASLVLELRERGASLHPAGRLRVTGLSVSRDNISTPAVDLSAAFDATVELQRQRATVSRFEIQGVQAGVTRLKGALSAPLPVSWGGAPSIAGESKLLLEVSGLDLSDWRALGGEGVPAGQITSTLRVDAREGGRMLALQAEAWVRGVVMKPGTGRFPGGDIHVRLEGEAKDLSSFSLKVPKAEVTRDGQTALRLEGSASYDRAGGAMAGSASLECWSSRLLGAGPEAPAALRLTTRGIRPVGGGAELEVFELSLDPTVDAPTNRLSARGRWLPSATRVGDTASSRLRVESPSLDLTRLHQIYLAWTGAAPQDPEAPVMFPTQEPASAALAARPMIVELGIDRLVIGEMKLETIAGSALIDAGRLNIKPLRLRINGAPAELDLSLQLDGDAPAYDIAWRFSGVPVEPLVNTFSPELRGQVVGLLTSTAHLRGAGITGSNLRRTLSGELGLSLTNANIRVVSGSKKLWIFPVNINLISSLLRLPELTRSPLTDIEFKAVAAGGEIRWDQAEIRGPALMARARGGIHLADVTGDSRVEVPLDIYLSRAVAAKAGLVPRDLPPDATYSPLPPFIKLGGTLSLLATETDNAQIVLLTARATGGRLGSAALGAIEGVGQAVGALGKLFGRDKNLSTNDLSTNSPSPSGPNPLNPFRRRPPSGQ